MRLTSFLRPHGEHIKLLSFISYRYHLFFIFLIVFLPCERIPFLVRTAEIPQGINLISPIPTLFFNSPYLSPMRLTSFLRPHGEHIKLLSFILYLYPSYFSFSLLYFYRASGFLSPFARRKYHKVCIQFSLYLPYFLTLLIEPHAADFLSPAAWGTHQTVIIHILQIPSIFHFPYCISTV